MPLERIVFVRRQSPDWALLAADHEAGRPINPDRYEPKTDIPGFPPDITACIHAWNNQFGLNFFRVRQRLKQISEASLAPINQHVIIEENELTRLPALAGNAQALVFFFDDDDLFAPDMFMRLARLDLTQTDIHVFPLVRLGIPVFTFVRAHAPARTVIGIRRDFGFRFQTNNYGLSSQIACGPHAPHLKDHVLGSTYATQAGLGDAWCDVLVSATNKTPCSANTIGQLLLDASGYRAFVQDYVATLRGLTIPPEEAWLHEPIAAAAALFSEVLAPASTGGVIRE